MPADMHSAVTVHSDMPAGTQSVHTHMPYCPAADFPLPMLLHKKSPAVPASSVMFHSVRSHFPVPYNPESLFPPVFLNRFRLL